jgi:hypothetical protein
MCDVHPLVHSRGPSVAINTRVRCMLSMAIRVVAGEPDSLRRHMISTCLINASTHETLTRLDNRKQQMHTSDTHPHTQTIVTDTCRHKTQINSLASTIATESFAH